MTEHFRRPCCGTYFPANHLMTNHIWLSRSATCRCPGSCRIFPSGTHNGSTGGINGVVIFFRGASKRYWSRGDGTKRGRDVVHIFTSHTSRAQRGPSGTYITSLLPTGSDAGNPIELSKSPKSSLTGPKPSLMVQIFLICNSGRLQSGTQTLTEKLDAGYHISA